MKGKLTDLELEAVHLRGRVAELERIVKAQEDELARLRGHDGALSEREWRVLDMWPRFEDGEPVMIDDDAFDCAEPLTVDRVNFYGNGFLLCDKYGCSTTEEPIEYGERVKRPAPEVLDADGVPIKVGDTVYMLDGDWCDALSCIGICGGDKMRVSALISPHGDGRLTCFKNKFICYPKPSQLTHREPDSWEKLFGEASVGACCYFGRVDKDGTERCEGCPAEQADCCTSTQMEDLIRRAKKLAGVAE